MTNSTMLTAARQPLAAIHLLIIMHCSCSFGGIEEHKLGFYATASGGSFISPFFGAVPVDLRAGASLRRCCFLCRMKRFSQATRKNALQDAEPAAGPALGPPLNCSMTSLVLYNLMYVTAGAGGISPFCQTDTEISRDSISHLQ